jgi:hypothetical protein
VLVVGDIDTENTRHPDGLPVSVQLNIKFARLAATPCSALALFVAGVGANHIDLALAAHDLAIFTYSLDARSHFHGFSIALNDSFVRRHGVIVIRKIVSSQPKPNLANIAIGAPYCKSGLTNSAV